MSSNVKRLLVGKREGFDLEAKAFNERFKRQFTYRLYR